jgi:hypothetical protein
MTYPSQFFWSRLKLNLILGKKDQLLLTRKIGKELYEFHPVKLTQVYTGDTDYCIRHLITERNGHGKVAFFGPEFTLNSIKEIYKGLPNVA